MAAALSSYQLGDLLGRGASGSVYRALNFVTGETVAIKSISLLKLPASTLPDIMSEIDLLKNLNHPNIVKYKGFARDREDLFIVLEYCENGSLQSILKKFGKFPEGLVAVYVSQILEGLIYLHEQGVIHRDIKGANILTNKDGSVKLADFGVSSRNTPGMEDDNEVVGSPYWMAPEIIEQSGASTASDIWSVGCVVMELLEGKPPYGDLAPMQALWRIVQDESMRVPEGASPVVKDFLYHCFQKDPNLRITAKKLLRHPWMQTARKALNLNTNEQTAKIVNPAPVKPATRKSSGSSVASQRVPTPPSGPPRSVARSLVNGTGASGTGGETVRAKKPVTVYDEAVQRVQEWNEALNASPKHPATIRRLPINSHARKPSVPNTTTPSAPLAHYFPTRPSNDSLAAQPATSANPSPAHGGLVGRNQHVSDVLSRAKEHEDERWDDDFAADITLSKLNHRKEETALSEDNNQRTLKPSRSPVLTTKPLPKETKSENLGRSVSDSFVEDYSDLALGVDDTGLESKLSQLKLKNKSRKAILHPDDLRKVKTLVHPPVQRSLSSPSKPSPPITPAPATPSTSTLSPRLNGIIPGRTPPGSKASSLRGKISESESTVELGKYTEKDEEDYSDMFDPLSGPSTLGSKDTQSLQLTKRSNRSWGESDHEDSEDTHDPFAEFEEEFSGDADDLEANLLRDKRATLCANVGRIIDALQPGRNLDELKLACDELLGMFQNSPEMALESHFVSAHGMLAVLEVLESRLSRDVAVRLLKVVNTIIMSDVESLESFCLVGGIPVIIAFTSKKHALDTRLEASTFIQQLTRSALTLQMFISCRGLRTLVELLDEDYTVNKTLILSALEGVESVFELQSPTPRNDFCRMFIREGILDPLSTSLLAILKDASITDDGASARSIGVMLLFCQVAQADPRVRDAFATRTIMMRILKACDALPRKLLVTAIKAIKHLATSPQLIEVLQNSNAMEILVGLLGKNIKGAHANDICSHIFQTIYSMTRLSKARQEEAASSGIIPLLKKVIQGKSPLKQFALPILCDLANAGKVSRRLLWQNEGLFMYLELLDDPYWRVSALDAILAWMQDETARVEDVLLEKTAADNLGKCFVQASGVSFENILDPFLKILRLSQPVTHQISTPTFFRRLADTLTRTTKAVTKLHLLRLTRVACAEHPERATLVSRFGLAEIVEKLGKRDDAVLVRELAKEIYPSLLFGNEVPELGKGARERVGLAEKVLGKAEERVLVRGEEKVLGKGEEKVLRKGEEKVLAFGTGGGLGLVEGKKGIGGLRRTGSEIGVNALGEKERVRMRSADEKNSVGREKEKQKEKEKSVVTMSPVKVEERPKHKRKISRSQLRDVQWQTDENGRLQSVRTPSRAG